MTPAGRLHLSLRDWAKFQRLFMADGQGPLTAESIERITTVPAGRMSSQAMGWALPVGQPARFALGQQGSNTLWVATAIIAADRRHAALVVVNDGRQRLIPASAEFAMRLLY